MLPCSDDVLHMTDESLVPFHPNRRRLLRIQRQHESSSKANRQLVKRNPPSSSCGTDLLISSRKTFTRNESKLNNNETRASSKPNFYSHEIFSLNNKLKMVQEGVSREEVAKLGVSELPEEYALLADLHQKLLTLLLASGDLECNPVQMQSRRRRTHKTRGSRYIFCWLAPSSSPESQSAFSTNRGERHDDVARCALLRTLSVQNCTGYRTFSGTLAIRHICGGKQSSQLLVGRGNSGGIRRDVTNWSAESRLRSAHPGGNFANYGLEHISFAEKHFSKKTNSK
ncbi:unnamed protein product [Protopolystoma xenopodis]|uniref:Uncharacterized protein n=1 Tax=Protopolystoma xenopodis TaxID=117903 RepID=A0A3S5AB87_9PLAT|nr:unnamed protein product [Protopolystoma xenopodis]